MRLLVQSTLSDYLEMCCNYQSTDHTISEMQKNAFFKALNIGFVISDPLRVSI